MYMYIHLADSVDAYNTRRENCKSYMHKQKEAFELAAYALQSGSMRPHPRDVRVGKHER